MPNGNPNMESFGAQQKDISQLGDMLFQQGGSQQNSRTDAIKQLLSNLDPNLANFIGENGKLSLGALDGSNSGWQAVNTDVASRQLFDTIKNSQKTSNDPIK